VQLVGVGEFGAEGAGEQGATVVSTCTNPDRPARWVLVVRGCAADLVLGMKQCLGQQGTDMAPA